MYRNARRMLRIVVLMFLFYLWSKYPSTLDWDTAVVL